MLSGRCALYIRHFMIFIVFISSLLMVCGDAKAAGDTTETFNQAYEKFRQGDLEAALRGFQAVLQVNPDDVEALTYVGLIYLRQKQYDQAIATLQKAVKLKGDRLVLAVAWNNLGCALQARGKLDEALKAYLEATKLDPNLQEAQHNLGSAYLVLAAQKERANERSAAQQLYRNAVQAYEKVIAMCASRSEAKITEQQLQVALKDAFAMLSTGNYDKAIERFRAIAVKRCDQPEVHDNLGRCYQQLRDMNKAIREFAQAVGLAPQVASYHANLGLALFAMGRTADAIIVLERAVNLGSKAPQVYYILGVAYEKKQRIPDAERAYKQAVQLNAQYWDAHVALAELYERRQQWDKALNEYLLAAAIKPQAALFNNIGRIYFQQGKRKEAIQHFQKAIKEDPNFITAHQNLAIAYRANGDLERAAAQWREIIRLQPNNMNARVELADVLIEMKRLDDAIQLCREVATKAPRNAAVHVLLGYIYYTRNNLGLAEQAYKKATELEPNNADAWNGLGAVYHRLRKFKEAEQCYQKALKIDPNHEMAKSNLERLRRSLSGR